MGRVFWGGVLITGHSCNRVPELSAAASSCPVSADAPRSHDTPRTSSRTFGGDSDSSSDPPGGAGAQPRAVRRGVYCLYLSCGLSIWSDSVGGTFRGRGLGGWGGGVGDYISHKATVRSAPSLGPEVATTSAFFRPPSFGDGLVKWVMKQNHQLSCACVIIHPLICVSHPPAALSS